MRLSPKYFILYIVYWYSIISKQVTILSNILKLFVTILTIKRHTYRTETYFMNQLEFSNTVISLQDKLFRIAKRLLVSSDEAQDACQEILSKLWEKRSDLDGLRSVEAYAITMTKNYCLDRLKLKEASNLRLVHSNYESASDNVQRTIEQQDQLDLIDAFLKTLPANQQLLFQLREVEGMEYDEIEKILDMKPTAIRVSLSRIRKQLREQLLKMNSYGIS